jgi:S1-C subfamily serine protease
MQAPATGSAAGNTVAAGRASKSIAQIYAADAPGVVQITQGNTGGSGFVVDTNGDIVTNAHVVDGSGAVNVSFSNNDNVPAHIVGVDNSTDIAVLKVSAPSGALVPLQMGDSSELRVGDSVVAIGNPFGLDRSASSGIVSALGRQIQAPNGFAINGAIQIDAAINHGNSGGPLLNAQGQVVGITSQIAASGVDANVGVGFAVPSNTVVRIVRELEATGSVAHAWVGVQLAPVDATIAAKAHLPIQQGAMITAVVPNGPAASAGFHPATGNMVVGGTSYGTGGDIITAVNGQVVTSPADLQTAIGALRAGGRISFAVVHPDGSTGTVVVTAGRQPTTAPVG